MGIVSVTGTPIKINQTVNTNVKKQETTSDFAINFTKSFAKNITSYSGVGSINLSNPSLTEEYNRMLTHSDYYKNNVLGVNNVVDESEMHRKTFFDERSGQTFEYTIIDGTTGIMLDKENYDKICALYPWGSKEHSFLLGQMRGTAKMVNGTPIEMIDAFPVGYAINVYDKDFNLVKTITVPTGETELDPDLFFNKLEKFAETEDMNDEFFWEKFLEELMA